MQTVSLFTCFRVKLSGGRRNREQLHKKLSALKNVKFSKQTQTHCREKPTTGCLEKLRFKYTNLKKKKNLKNRLFCRTAPVSACAFILENKCSDFTVGGVSHRDSKSQKMATSSRNLNTTTGHSRDPLGIQGTYLSQE